MNCMHAPPARAARFNVFRRAGGGGDQVHDGEDAAAAVHLLPAEVQGHICSVRAQRAVRLERDRVCAHLRCMPPPQPHAAQPRLRRRVDSRPDVAAETPCRPSQVQSRCVLPPHIHTCSAPAATHGPARACAQPKVHAELRREATAAAGAHCAGPRPHLHACDHCRPRVYARVHSRHPVLRTKPSIVELYTQQGHGTGAHRVPCCACSAIDATRCAGRNPSPTSPPA